MPNRALPRCRLCSNENEGGWTWQPFGPGEDALNFVTPGWHARGFPAIQICDGCKQAIELGQEIEFMYRGARYVINRPENTTLPVRFVRDAGPLVHVLVEFHADWDVAFCGDCPADHDWRDVSLTGVAVGELCVGCFQGFAEWRERKAQEQKRQQVQQVA